MADVWAQIVGVAASAAASAVAVLVGFGRLGVGHGRRLQEQDRLAVDVKALAERDIANQRAVAVLETMAAGTQAALVELRSLVKGTHDRLQPITAMLLNLEGQQQIIRGLLDSTLSGRGSKVA